MFQSTFHHVIVICACLFFVCGTTCQADMNLFDAIDAAEKVIETYKGRMAYEPAKAKLKAIIDSNITDTEKIEQIKKAFSLVVPSENAPSSIGETMPPKAIDWVKRSAFGSKGNVTVYVDKEGTPYEVYVVGVAPISTTLIAVEAAEDAREEAEFNAKSSFALWMHENLKVKIEREKKRIVIRQGAEGNPTKEQSESTIISHSKATQVAQGMWRGMSVFWMDMGKSTKGRCIMVWRWSIKEHELAKLVEMLTHDGDPDALDRKPDMKINSFQGFRQ